MRQPPPDLYSGLPMLFHSRMPSESAPARPRRWGVVLQLLALTGTASLAACATQGNALSGAGNAQSAPANASLSELLAAADRATMSGQYPLAARWYVQAVKLTDDEQVVEDAAQDCYDHQQLQATMQIAQRWLAINPTSQQAHELAAMSAIKLYQVDAAVEQLQALLDSAYITPAAGFMEWLNKIPATDAHAALAVMKKLLMSHAQMAEANYAVARLAELTDDLSTMMSHAQRAHELAPFWSPAGFLLARAQLLRGQTELAIQTGQSVVKNDDSLATRSEYASLLLAADKPNEAVQLWKELEQSEGDNSAAVRSLAYLDYQVGNFQSAFNRFNMLLNSGNSVSECIFYLAGIAERTGATAEARQLYGRVQEGQFAMSAQLRIAQIIKGSEGLTNALTYLQTYGETNPEEMLLSLQARAQMLSESGDEAATLKLYDQAVRDYPDVASLRMSRAFQLIKMDKIALGLQAMRELVQSRPQDPAALNALGYTLLDHSKQYQQGYEYIEAAWRSSPDSAAIKDSMGWALFKLDRKEESLVYLQQAAGMMRDDEIELHLGEVLWSLSRHDEALAVWQKALEHAPDNKSLQERIKRAGKLH